MYTASTEPVHVIDFLTSGLYGASRGVTIVNIKPETKNHDHGGARKESWLDLFLRQQRYQRVVPLIKPKMAVCDIGCGDGSLLVRLGGAIKYGLGLDQRIETKRVNNLEYKKCDFNRRLPVASKKFDAVVMLAVLEHVPDIELIMREVARILKKRGIFIATTPTPHGRPILEFLSYGIGLVDPREIADHKRYLTLKDLCQKSHEVGIDTIRAYTFQFGGNLFFQGRRTR